MKLDDYVGKVVTLKITSGEELIARIDKIEDGVAYVREPFSVAPGPNGIGLIPSLFTAEERGETRLNINAITLAALAEEKVKEKYIQATSNLIVPDKKLILG